jgi:hypothetical protein
MTFERDETGARIIGTGHPLRNASQSLPFAFYPKSGGPWLVHRSDRPLGSAAADGGGHANVARPPRSHALDRYEVTGQS